MSDTAKQSPKSFKWRLECLGHSLVEGLAGLLPPSVLFRLGEALGGLAWRLLPERRKVVIRNLRIAFAGEKDLAEIEVLAKQSFRRTGGNMVSVARTARLNRQQLRDCVKVSGFEHFEQALAQGRGMVILVPHMGNWEVLSRLNLLLPRERVLGAFYRPLNNELMNERVLKRREADGTRMFSKHDGALQAAGFLRGNGVLGILADQRTGRVGEPVPFFGRITRSSPLPGLLARRVKCPVIALSNVTVKPGSWRVTFYQVDPPYTTGACMKAIESAMKTSPEDYFWLQDRWKVYVRKTRTIREWLGGADTRGAKPHRALLWLAGVPGSWRLPEDWSHPDVIYELVLAGNGARPGWLPADVRIHRIAINGNRATVRRQLAAIDAADPLPVDFILAPHACRALVKAGRSEQIPVIDLD